MKDDVGTAYANELGIVNEALFIIKLLSNGFVQGEDFLEVTTSSGQVLLLDPFSLPEGGLASEQASGHLFLKLGQDEVLLDGLFSPPHDLTFVDELALQRALDAPVDDLAPTPDAPVPCLVGAEALPDAPTPDAPVPCLVGAEALPDAPTPDAPVPCLVGAEALPDAPAPDAPVPCLVGAEALPDAPAPDAPVPCLVGAEALPDAPAPDAPVPCLMGADSGPYGSLMLEDGYVLPVVFVPEDEFSAEDTECETDIWE